MASDFRHLRPLHPAVTGDHGLIQINGSQAALFGTPTPFNLVGKDPMDPAASVAMALGPPQLQLGCGNGVDESAGEDKGMKRGMVYSGINYNDGNSYGEDSMEYNMLSDQHDEVGSYGILSLGDQVDQQQQKLIGACSLMKGARRLGYEQVKALERAFESDNRLEPERKVRLASQLGLQPRQVAVWFQNRRARWKTKQLEKDYAILKSNFDALKSDRDKLLQEKHHLQAQLARLKGDVVESKQTTTQVEQDSTTLVSCSNAPNNKSPEENDPGLEVDASLGEKQENDSLSSTEDSESNGAIEEPSSITILQTQNPSKSIINESEYYNHLRFSSHQVPYKGGVKNEESWETIEEHGSLNFPAPDWYWS